MTRLRHGMAKTKVYRIWRGMKSRCLNPNVRAYGDYGGRGIAVCERWLVFDNFFADMGEPPEGMTLERVDNDQGYNPGNCTWAPRVDQARNQRSNRLLTIDGETLTMTEWGERSGIKAATIWNRLKLGWPPEDAVKVSTNHKRKGIPRGQRIYAFGAEHGVVWSEPAERHAA